ncbi:MAG: hypothetical protein KJO07_17260 [Deltaproteobacteria bacterium]|nr:hypothetical protein [Deltaproteobacteria bacterium]
MGKLAALRTHAVEIRARTVIEVDLSALVLTPPGGRPTRVDLARCAFTARDAELFKRFVRHLRISRDAEHIDLVTPPEEGSIAPRVARLPAAPSLSFVIDRPDFDVIACWLARGGSLRGQTVAELARLAMVATSSYAVHIGEWAAQVAVDMTSDVCGPLRGCASPRQVLAPLMQAARTSERASEALVAALAKSAVVAYD